MNTPPYSLVDVFGEIVARVKEALALPVLNYQYGYVKELNETLLQYDKTPEFSAQKYPLIWLAQPFTVERGIVGYHGEIRDLRVLIMHHSSKTLKSYERMEQVFKPIIYPIYDELMKQLNLHEAIGYDIDRKHRVVDTYYWGENQQSVLNDVVDCSILQSLNVKLNINNHCKPFKNI